MSKTYSLEPIVTIRRLRRAHYVISLVISCLLWTCAVEPNVSIRGCLVGQMACICGFRDSLVDICCSFEYGYPTLASWAICLFFGNFLSFVEESRGAECHYSTVVFGGVCHFFDTIRLSCGAECNHPTAASCAIYHSVVNFASLGASVVDTNMTVATCARCQALGYSCRLHRQERYVPMATRYLGPRLRHLLRLFKKDFDPVAEAHPDVAGALAAIDREVGFAMPKGAPRLRRGRVRLLEMESRLRMKRLRNQVDIWEGREGL